MDVTLRPVREADLDLFEQHTDGPDGTGPLQWFGYRSFHAMRRDFADNGLLSPEGGRFTIEADGAPAGTVSWHQSAWGPLPTSWCWTIGIAVFPGYRGKGIGTQAQRQLAAYLFAHTRAERVQASTDVANIAEQRALSRAGRAGGPHPARAVA
ncbi:GNAT family protein [Nonomuraea africana]|uniref:Aminoglycoside 6'-N-acetyltransferase n=1 Tax=Nonomuraea africana TaxID=46171 RepID=A0ABR9K9U0_9ACTN|nr:GNAT family protein [Nonomuraea africana]MBE1558785.1 aminoglycoside 6'-N-acetyltransferase [Nonomuraea africana]